jgi:hypothetical protein
MRQKGRPTMKEGICKLTGEKGKFVKCYIIPAALTKLAGTNRLIQSGPDDRSKKERAVGMTGIWSQMQAKPSWHDMTIGR